MKKSILVTATTFLFTSCITAAENAPIIDSATAQILAEKTIIIADALNKQIIQGVDNGITGTLISLAVAAIYRLIEKRRIIRKVKENERARLTNFYNRNNG